MEIVVDSLKIQAVTVQISSWNFGFVFLKDQSLIIETPEPNTSKTLLCRCSLILVLHNLFHQSKFTRNITLNTQYIVYFRNPRDMSSISNLTRQLSPQNSKNLQNLFMDVINTPYGYILIDLNQFTPEIFKFRTDIFNREKYINCFATSSIIDNFKNANGIFSNTLI